MNILLALALCGQLQAPLNDAACVYRAQPYAPGATLIPNEGTRIEPLYLGPTLLADEEDPEYVADQELGGYLHYVPSEDDHGVAFVPVSVLNGDVSFAIRIRPETQFTERMMLSISDPTTPYITKHFFFTIMSTNKYESRFWEHPSVGWAQIGAISTTSAAANRTDTVVTTWTTATKLNKLYVNGVLERTFGTGKQRSDAASSGLQVPLPYTALRPSGKVFAIGVWERTLSDAEVAALQVNADWHAGGGAPPPPPVPGLLRVIINGTEQPQGTTVTIDGVAVQPPTGPADKIVEVDTP